MDCNFQEILFIFFFFSQTLYIPSPSNQRKQASTFNQHISPLLSSMEECVGNLDAPKHDLISQLPDKLIHKILSFLDMMYVVQTSILGKRWRYLWTSLPFLTFHEEEYNRYMATVGEGEQKLDYKNFTDFLNRILRLRNGTNLKIQRFCLCCDEGCFREYDIASALNYTGGCSQQISEYKALNLSKCFYTQPDHYVGLPCLNVLHLESVFLVGGESTDNFFTSCPVLETLIILDCVVMQTNKLNISAPQLKYLQLGNLSTNMCQSMFFLQVGGYLKVTVSAPNLTSFKCTDLGSVVYSLVDVSSLVEADIDVEFPTRVLYSGTDEKDAQIVIECLAALCNVRSLRVSALWLEDVYEVCKARMESLVTPFCNLSLLKLRASLATSEYHAIAYLFEKCPNVETLVLEMTEPPERRLTTAQWIEILTVSPREVKSVETKKKSLESNLLSECNLSLHQLKYVMVGNAIGSLNELEFLKFLLKNATVLEKITVYISKIRLLDHEMLRRFSEELVTFSGFISAGVIVSIV